MWFLSAIPVIGQVANAIASYFNKRQEVDLEKYKVKGKVDIEAIQADLATMQTRARLVEQRSSVDEVGRMWVIWPVGVYTGIYFYYHAFANLLPPYLIWQPLAVQSSMEYIPYGVLAYLLAINLKKP